MSKREKDAKLMLREADERSNDAKRNAALMPRAADEKDEALRSVLRRVQRMWIEKKGLTIFLVSDDADWLVIMQCLQDHGLFASGNKRPPLKAFVKWVQENQIAQLLTICDDYYLSMASRKLHGARYPWDNVEWNPHVLVRWRKLYKILDQKLTELTM